MSYFAIEFFLPILTLLNPILSPLLFTKLRNPLVISMLYSAEIKKFSANIRLPLQIIFVLFTSNLILSSFNNLYVPFISLQNLPDIFPSAAKIISGLSLPNG